MTSHSRFRIYASIHEVKSIAYTRIIFIRFIYFFHSTKGSFMIWILQIWLLKLFKTLGRTVFRMRTASCNALKHKLLLTNFIAKEFKWL